MKKTLAYTLALLATLLFIGAAGYILAVWLPQRALKEHTENALKTAERVSDFIRTTFNITPECHDRTIVCRIDRTESIFELSTVSRQFTHVYQYSTKWLGSRKMIELAGVYEAKAGIDLNYPLKMRVSGDGRKLSVEMPRASLHSLTTLEEKAVEEESGYWNRITSADKEIALRSLREDARRSLMETDILRQAELRCYQQLRGQLEKAGILNSVTIEKVERLD